MQDDETEEWLHALSALSQHAGLERASYVLGRLLEHAAALGVPTVALRATPYINTIPSHLEDKMPDDGVQLTVLTDIMRWNAMAMVMRAGRVNPELGGHLASYASIATLFEVGFQHFFHAPSAKHDGDLVYFQGHSSPGIYARAFLEGRLTEQQLEGFRQELSAEAGLSSYPHPWLMPQFWQFPTVSMGLGPLMAIYQAHFLKYLMHRELLDTTQRKVWAFCGDGEMDEPESLGALNVAGREQLDNLIFVVNCNLQRLDGPVWGNGQIIQEYESIYRAASWNVIKVVWGSNWDPLLKKDTQGLLAQRMAELLDGEFQLYASRGPAFMREHFFGRSPQLKALVEDWSDADLAALQDGGHDPQKVYAAYSAAVKHKGQPTVILAKTVKGYGMGASGEAKNITHQAKKMQKEDLQQWCERFKLPIKERDVEALNYYKPAPDSAPMQYLHRQREALGGGFPVRSADCAALAIPPLQIFNDQLEGTGDREVSSTMAFVRILSTLLRDKNIKDRVVPIVADESRTFGMEGLFRQIGIYAPSGQHYEPEDRQSLLYYREDQKGQLLQEGLSEAGAMSSWIAAATSYSSSRFPMIPFFIYYSMFGYQRFGDLAWAAGDARARGFLLGATAGRTTLAGEGLQHQDGHNLLMFGMVPNCISYDPAFAYELAVIIHDGLRRMYVEQEDVYYYLTLMNENYAHPAMPDGAEADIIKGMYLFRESKKKVKKYVQLLGSGTILREVLAAADCLEAEYGVAADVWSVTSFNELRKDMESASRYRRLHPEERSVRLSHVSQCLSGRPGPVIAATDYLRLFADQIRSDITAPYYTLGTDGYGRSDTRQALRDFFEVDTKMIVYTALYALAEQGQLSKANLRKAIQRLAINVDRADPMSH